MTESRKASTCDLGANFAPHKLETASSRTGLGAVAQVEIKFPAVIGDAQIDVSFLTVEQGFRLEQLQRGADGLRAGAVASLPVIGPQQEELERAGADGVILEVAIDPN